MDVIKRQIEIRLPVIAGNKHFNFIFYTIVDTLYRNIISSESILRVHLE